MYWFSVRINSIGCVRKDYYPDFVIVHWIAFYDNIDEKAIEVNKMPGSHGSLTKAGKVRESTPKVHGRVRRTPIPRIRNKRNYVRRFIRGEVIGVKK